ncbi:MAG: OB-fold domain-containing protein [Candidatus Rokubacteria bacterium]|nr:OB-fold domain-containing protein [Candidatus Rokubacteria bacterium]
MSELPERVDYRDMMLIVPRTDSEWRGYFEAARAGRLVVHRCEGCGLLRYPPGAGCPWCASLAWSWHEVSGRGAIYSYEIVVQAIQPGFRDWAPYPVVVVELDEQRGVPTPDDELRLVANLLTRDFRPEAEERVAIGARVEVLFQPIAPDFVLPQFCLSAEPPQGRLWRLPGEPGPRPGHSR